ncbi:unnamed protein product [Lepeophtheirus salmonis]|uniref:(salmon louse) hypothetical protein n=1 Tax=Lepeophtheirus salmonis TaxID=72036 RepID=A0A7R8CUJ3_LEPSM|nr:unnamed protein product [Lepeophtheirus salmonis]CAB4064158.1 unnamed protein product [Lepeophtheirus salmonis]CAF2937024.1 unnamed protein product [Lepeophtheirus salmonis]CAF2937041.1 unnamed protein product [Lepeophtheirus salmonis]
MYSSSAPLGVHHKSVEELLDVKTDPTSDQPRSYIQGRCPEIITDGMADMHDKVSEFVVGFENAQKGNDLLLSQWEDTLEDVDNYSQKLRKLKELFACRITQLNSTLKRPTNM